MAAPPAQEKAIPVYTLRLFNLHTRERLNLIYRERDAYLPQALERLDDFLRDSRTGAVRHYDPRVFDLLRDLMRSLGRPGAEIDVICAYRTPWSNEYLRHHTDGVAKHSLHVEAKAIDIRVLGVKSSEVRDAAVALHRGGVGYYPVSDFVHVDVGRPRQWSLPPGRS